MLLRHDLQMYESSLLEMRNWIPTLQGTAERAPGSQFIQDTGVARDARIIPYRAVNQAKGVIQLTENTLDFKTGVLTAAAGTLANIGSTKQIVPNGDLNRGQGDWVFEPTQYIGGSGDQLGMRWGGGFILGNCRYYKFPGLDKDFIDIATTAEVDVATDNVLIEYALKYSNFFEQGDYELIVKVGTTLGGDEVYTRTWDNPNNIPPTTLKESAPIPGGAFTGTLFINIHIVALPSDAERYSQPQLALNYFRIWAAAEAPPADVNLATSYLAEELADIHFVASPYDFDPRYQKPIVFVHPNHPPSWFFWDGNAAAYKFEVINFGAGGGYEIPEWVVGNYPSTCTAVQGRLVLSATPRESETTWLTRVAQWDKFDDIASLDDVTPEDSMEFTSVYRSAIRWVSGHKNLLVGTDEIEYLAHADGIFQPSDLGVSVQTTHGGAHVQPVGFGPSVLFAAEGGHRVREARFSADEDGWIAADLTLWHPDLFASGIVRLVRMRNPHQMLVAVMGNGQIALLHQDNYAKVTGWSRITLNAVVIDACVLVDDVGIDVLYVLVRRKVDGVDVLYIEAFADWTDFNNLVYLSSHSIQNFPDGATNIITGLDHLEGDVVQVVGDEQYLGSFVVTAGQITLLTQVGTAIPVLKAVVGRDMSSVMRTLPPPSDDPGSKKRYVDVAVRVRGSTRPIINGERPKDRAPATLMDTSEPLDLINDYKVTNLGSDEYQIITIEETVPFRSEILGIYGKLRESST